MFVDSNSAFDNVNVVNNVISDNDFLNDTECNTVVRHGEPHSKAGFQNILHALYTEGEKVRCVFSHINAFDWYFYCCIQCVVMQLVFIHKKLTMEGSLFAYYSFQPDLGVVFINV